jgi:DNA-nicking Smr family endonuclease
VDDDNDRPIEFPIDGILDLHHFSPKDVKTLIPAYIDACLEQGIVRLRIIHGKGSGQLRETVHAILGRDARVTDFGLDPDPRSSWGATLVNLRSQSIEEADQS